MIIRKYLIGYDSFERHKTVARLIPDESTCVLDVGGADKLLAQFTGKPVVVVNLGQGDVRANGLLLPFSDSAFETVTSLDVLEHIPPAQRCGFIREMLRVCRDQLVICAPYGSPEHMLSERRLLDRIHREGVSDQMLREHVENGLPTLETFQGCVPDVKIKQTWYSGIYSYNIFCFRIDHLFGVNRLRGIKILIAMLLNLVGNTIVFPLHLSRSPRSNTNRIYVVLSKL